ncbi:hypothetical protein L3X38_020117 [Prunus dulcis]|uniref:Uncharacterized protein n=1 Tax=Prunus dulcis TaxID=3755 RepID=A0AAD4WD63_PRUDU|nr:hypothetical protein L3X38_020117 [Prunus dulcis]
MDKAPDTLPPCSVDSLVDLLPSVTSGSCGNEFDNHTNVVLKVSIAQGVKLRPKVERSYSSCAKATCSSELESVVFHEDEAHFGDLFCESGRGLQNDMISHQLLLTLAPARTHNIDRLCLSWDDIGSTMSSILGFWKAKPAAVVEDLAAKSVWKELCEVFDLWVLLLIF